MTSPHHQDERRWKDAEALVERVEQASRLGVLAKSFFDDLADDLRLTTSAAAVTIWSEDGSCRTTLSRSGLAIRVDEGDASPIAPATDHASHSHWTDGQNPSGGRLQTRLLINTEVRMGLDLQFDLPHDLTRQQALAELTEVVLDLASHVFLRSRVSQLRSKLGEQSDHDALISQLHEGLDLGESFASIASAIAREGSIDRVSLLQTSGARYRLIATSTRTSVDRRARQARLLEQLVRQGMTLGNEFDFQVGSPKEVKPEISELLEPYLHESGCREIHVESVHDGDVLVAVIVMEQFCLNEQQEDSIRSSLDSIREPVHHAIRVAIKRDDAAWGMIASRFTGQSGRRKGLAIALAICTAMIAACLVPADLRISADGQIVPAQRQRLFAPTEGIVTEVAVQNGQQVRQGQTLVVLHSPKLDLRQRETEADLATARTRLASLLTVRSRSRGSESRQQESAASADEQVLKKEIAGLEEQLQLIRNQQADLTIKSPINGQVDRWDMRAELAARPVTFGQHLVDVISNDDGWTVELDVPEKNIGYLLAQQRIAPCKCTLRLRSNPTETHQGTVDHVADVAHVDPLGESIVRAIVPLESVGDVELRSGATVIAQIHCGQRPVGFVWLRGLIEWSRRQAWF